jgi:hypothetical protein
MIAVGLNEYLTSEIWRGAILEYCSTYCYRVKPVCYLSIAPRSLMIIYVAYCIRQEAAEFCLELHSWEREEFRARYDEKPAWGGYLVLKIIKNY